MISQLLNLVREVGRLRARVVVLLTLLIGPNAVQAWPHCSIPAMESVALYVWFPMRSTALMDNERCKICL